MLDQSPHRPPWRSAPRLVWPGRDDTQVVFCADDDLPRQVPRRVLPTYRLEEAERHGAGEGLLIWGENYHALRTLLAEGYAGRVGLVYIDPPFNTGRRFEHYDDQMGQGYYLSMLHNRLELLRDLLAETGTIVVHVDDKVSHLVRLLLDELFGPENYRNEIVVKRVHKNLQRQFSRVQALPRAHDVCLVYSRRPDHRYPLPLLPKPAGPKHPQGYWKDFWSTADRPTMRYELLGVTPSRGQWKWRQQRAEAAVANYRAYLAVGGELVDYWRRTGETLEFIRLSEQGRPVHWIPPVETLCATDLWSDIPAYASRREFPTEKSEALLERLLELFSQPGDLILDCFAGSGTTGAVAARLGRRWILVERGQQAVSHIIPRLTALADGGCRLCRLVSS